MSGDTVEGEIVQVYVSFDRLPKEIQNSMPDLQDGVYKLVRVDDDL